ncbi:(E,E)-geranyllinalool synthase [Senna tora]|uniref:(E,E)-geranyllinalool synthase n=1 Tax=Senna tora TaxID=362788 RepID=A0A834XIK7_9FABA|nr:(E,E)-geranyllinalool synthase [Senna tora]
MLRVKWYETFVLWLIEAKWSRNGENPYIDDYLKTGMVSIATHTLVLLASCFLNLHHRQLRPLQYQTITKLLMLICRVLNDLQSYEKEKEEGKMNSVLINLIENSEIEMEDSKGIVRDIIDRKKKEFLEHRQKRFTAARRHATRVVKKRLVDVLNLRMRPQRRRNRSGCSRGHIGLGHELHELPDIRRCPPRFLTTFDNFSSPPPPPPPLKAPNVTLALELSTLSFIFFYFDSHVFSNNRDNHPSNSHLPHHLPSLGISRCLDISTVGSASPLSDGFVSPEAACSPQGNLDQTPDLSKIPESSRDR